MLQNRIETIILALIGAVILTFVVDARSALAQEAKTNLSQKAATLKMNMTREQVIKKLGRATWAILPDDKDDPDWQLPHPNIMLELYWDNGKCTPVVAQFTVRGGKFLLTGWDEGRSQCFDKAYPKSLKPSKKFSCAKPDRKKICR